MFTYKYVSVRFISVEYCIDNIYLSYRHPVFQISLQIYRVSQNNGYLPLLFKYDMYKDMLRTLRIHF